MRQVFDAKGDKMKSAFNAAPAPLTRRSLLVTAGVAGLATIGLARPARAAAEFNFKLATNLPPTHPLNVRAKEAADRIAKESGGRAELMIFPGNQLGADADLLSQLRSGGLDFLAMSGLVASTLVPGAAITGMGFAFNDYAAVWQALDGKLGAFVRAELAKANLFAMPKIWDNGFRQMTTSTRPIKAVDDLKGMKMRVPVSPLWTSMFKALDAAPTGMAPPELYSALQTGIVDGQENGLVAILFTKLYEVQKYCALTNHMWDGYWMLSNKRNFDKLPREIQEIVQRNLDAAALDQRADVQKMTASAQADLEKFGLKFNTVDKAPFREKLSRNGFYKEWQAKLGQDAWATLEASVGKMG